MEQITGSFESHDVIQVAKFNVDDRTIMHYTRYLCAVFAVFLTITAQALTYVPTDEQWISWPEMCRVKYPQSGAGRNSKYARLLNPEAIARWENLLGHRTWDHVHHYCAGLGKLQLAERENYDGNRQFLLVGAAGEFSYSLRNDNLSSLLAPRIVSALSGVLLKLGRTEEAKKHLRDIIAAQPRAAEPYAVLAKILKKEGDLRAAVELLQQGNSHQIEPSAELSYMLGLYYCDEGKFELARTSADIAYRLGYPLPGLKNRLVRAGYW